MFKSVAQVKKLMAIRIQMNIGGDAKVMAAHLRPQWIAALANMEHPVPNANLAALHKDLIFHHSILKK